MSKGNSKIEQEQLAAIVTIDKGKGKGKAKLMQC